MRIGMIGLFTVIHSPSLGATPPLSATRNSSDRWTVLTQSARGSWDELHRSDTEVIRAPDVSGDDVGTDRPVDARALSPLPADGLAPAPGGCRTAGDVLQLVSGQDEALERQDGEVIVALTGLRVRSHHRQDDCLARGDDGVEDRIDLRAADLGKRGLHGNDIAHVNCHRRQAIRIGARKSPESEPDRKSVV